MDNRAKRLAAINRGEFEPGKDAAPGAGGPGPYGPLLPADALGLQLPAGFRSRIVAQGGELVTGTSHLWHLDADGGGTFRVPGGYVYVSNSKRDKGKGGVGAIKFDHRGRIVDAYSICSGTNRNCSGGPPPAVVVLVI